MTAMTLQTATTTLIDQVTNDGAITVSELADILTLVPHLRNKQLEPYTNILSQIEMDHCVLGSDAQALLEGLGKYWTNNCPRFYDKYIRENDSTRQDYFLAVLRAYPKFIRFAKTRGLCGQSLECNKHDQPEWFLPLPTKRLQFKDHFESMDMGYALYTQASKEEGVSWLRKRAAQSMSESLWLYIKAEQGDYWFNVGKNCTEETVDPDSELMNAAFLLAGVDGAIVSATVYHTHPEQTWTTPGAVVVYERTTHVTDLFSTNDMRFVERMKRDGEYYHWPVSLGVGLVTSRGVYEAREKESVDTKTTLLDPTVIESCQNPLLELASQKRRYDITTTMITQSAACYTEKTDIQVSYESF
ncbi:hypothetical protein KJ708_03900 [bacterium]|nr:hypothetical protein [bacterium]